MEIPKNLLEVGEIDWEPPENVYGNREELIWNL